MPTSYFTNRKCLEATTGSGNNNRKQKVSSTPVSPVFYSSTKSGTRGQPYRYFADALQHIGVQHSGKEKRRHVDGDAELASLSPRHVIIYRSSDNLTSGRVYVMRNPTHNTRYCGAFPVSDAPVSQSIVRYDIDRFRIDTMLTIFY